MAVGSFPYEEVRVRKVAATMISAVKKGNVAIPGPTLKVLAGLAAVGLLSFLAWLFLSKLKPHAT